MDSSDVMAVLAHRYPFLLVDRIDVLESGKRVHGRKQITGGEWQLWGGSLAAMPSMLVVEALAQTSAALLKGIATVEQRRVVSASFTTIVRPATRVR